LAKDLKEKVETLEDTLQAFIRHTDRSFTKVNNAVIDLHNEMQDFKDEMQDFKDEMQDFKDEMRDFKDEMKGFKDEMKGFKDEMQGFKGEMARKWGELANRLGTLAEDIVAPNLVPVAQKYFGCQGEPFDFMLRRTRTHSKESGRSREFDAIAIFEDTVILSETKATPRSEYLQDFSLVIKDFFDYFPELADKKLIPIFASLNMGDNIIKQATKNRIFVMALKGDTMEILNYDDIQKK